MAETDEPIVGVLIKDPNTSGQEIILVLHDSSLSVGRLPDNDIYLPDRTVRRRHCRLEVEQRQIYLVTDYPNMWLLLNGKPVPYGERCRLKFGDMITIGRSVFHLEQSK